ncbi:MAG: EF-hand domain-containing protein [Verrucomicrobia bacterium]|nr:EF-hand domain-containing protein [Verrucomicrobiota bacterium]MBU1736021.1 EF-hand domain-containing protein [Verrucomicrobiota bacterium]MBU1858117.1 EF-hand domain-containing protein [Verrucomicrobiota bacterium]
MQIIRQCLLMMGLGLVIWAVAAQAQTSAVGLATAARAQTNATLTFFQSADTNSDGQVSQAEFAGHAKTSTFERLDQDKDGMITLEEWKAVNHSPEAEKHFEAMDKDRNGRISYPEFSDTADWKSALNDSFKSLDRDRDSNLTPDELTGRPMFRLLSVDF